MRQLCGKCKPAVLPVPCRTGAGCAASRRPAACLFLRSRAGAVLG
jgi:hypothetical protein